MQERAFYQQTEDHHTHVDYKSNPRTKDITSRAATAVNNIDAVLANPATYIDRKCTLLTKSSPEAFSFDYDQSISREALYEDIVSYLGEYRFEIPEYRYKQRFSKTTSDEALRLRGEKDDTPMTVLGIHAIAEKTIKGEGTQKVKADLAGMQRVEQMLTKAKTGDRILYASPPDPEYGYEYGFFYDGKVEALEDGEKILHLRALRIDNAEDIETFNTALTKIVGKETTHVTPNDFIENPEHIQKPISDAEITNILQRVFQFENGDVQYEKFKSNINQMQPYISGVIDLIKNGAPLAQVQQAFHALENYALSLKESSKHASETTVYKARSSQSSVDFQKFINAYGYEPPKVQGSCGSSGGRSSNNIFGFGSIFTGTSTNKASQEWFTCPECAYKASGPIGTTCPGCGLTKESYAEKSGVVCD